jgi:hypothetical protein
MPMPLLLVVIIIILVSLLVIWQLKQPRHAKGGVPWIETRSDLQVWLLVLAAFVTGILIAYVLFAPVVGG